MPEACNMLCPCSSSRPREIHSLAKCNGPFPAGSLVPWDLAAFWNVSKCSVIHLRQETILCTPNYVFDKLFLTAHVSSEDLWPLCQRINGHLPVLTSKNDLNTFHNEFIKARRQMEMIENIG